LKENNIKQIKEKMIVAKLRVSEEICNKKLKKLKEENSCI
jgi:hypothetical protein